MGVIPDGLGSTWSLIENVDIDQGHGLDYRATKHVAVGLRKRLEHEHTTLADATVGGDHVPGKCAILDIVDATADITMDDSTYHGRNLIYDQTTNCFYCFTNTDGTTTADAAIALPYAIGSVCLAHDNTVIWGTTDTTDGAFLDLDDMSTDMADRVASQQSIRAFASMKVTAKTTNADHTLDSFHLSGNYMFTNTGAGADVTIYIGDGAAGQKVYFCVDVTTQVLAADTSNNKHIKCGDITSGVNGYVCSSHDGASWSMTDNGTEWIVADVVGIISICEEP